MIKRSTSCEMPEIGRSFEILSSSNNFSAASKRRSDRQDLPHHHVEDCRSDRVAVLIYSVPDPVRRVERSFSRPRGRPREPSTEIGTFIRITVTVDERLHGELLADFYGMRAGTKLEGEKRRLNGACI
jgi:hypothetical protein